MSEMDGTPVAALVLADTALETVPENIVRHPAVRKDAERRRKDLRGILLDRSVHHAAMLRLDEAESRGRPDIPYHVLLDVTATPAYSVGRLELYIHTRKELVITISKGLRPPRSYDRFRNLVEQLFVEGRVGKGSTLMALEPLSFAELLNRIRPTRVIGLSRLGKPTSLEVLVNRPSGRKPCYVVGGFPSGHFRPDMENCFDEMWSVSKRTLDASLVAARLVYEIEKRMHIE
jgi:rRNA small subunit pseudouridine methyltransferase Nep1